MSGSLLKFLGPVVFLLGLNVHAEPLSDAKIVMFKNGVNDVLLEGHRFTIVSAWRENYNAHGFNVTTIYAQLPTPGGKTLLQVVPVFLRNVSIPNDPRETNELVTSGGADCTLHSFRLFVPKSATAIMLVVADRDYGDSYVDTQPVHFDFYRLAQNTEGLFGRPRLYFTFDHRLEASKRYCDVEKALKDELALPWVGGASLPWSDSGK
ncbi:hypothetical protein [Dyella sp. RRB7]|uniref:hypothetical protein n=1 Tax=Dyella sp. RRB7 TaxID=2919502 RepID=UPI001FAB14FF|nr:hypothetical protein [Dyella sp. RRB7]